MSGVPPSYLKLEISERTIKADPKRAGEEIRRLISVGVGLVVDDFGTSKSSVACLRQSGANEIKIDRELVRHMSAEITYATEVKSIIEFARSRKLEVVAKGVEDEETRDLLLTHGCDRMQGYFLARPMNVGALGAWLASLAGYKSAGV